MEKSLSQATKTNVRAQNIMTFLNELKLLTKGIVLYANVLPVLAGFLLALHFTGSSFIEHIDLLIYSMIGSTFVVAGALILNNWYEVDLDTEMKRTEKRPTVTGHIPLNVVLMLGVLFTIVGFVFMMFTTMEATVYAFLGWFTYVVLYTFWTKRRTTLNTIIGSVSGAFTPLIGWAAIDSAYHVVPITIFAVLFIWQIPHTFAIAIRRFDDYKAAGVPMLPVVYGIPMTKRQMVIYIACLLPLPFLLTSLGITFIVIATILNVGWLILAIRGFFMKDNLKWANMMFYSSLTYLSLFFAITILFTWVN